MSDMPCEFEQLWLESGLNFVTDPERSLVFFQQAIDALERRLRNTHPSYFRVNDVVDMETLKDFMSQLGSEPRDDFAVEQVLNLRNTKTGAPLLFREPPRDKIEIAVTTAFDEIAFLNPFYYGEKVSVISALIASLAGRSRLWIQGTEYYAAYTAAISPAMVGKSRCFEELKNHGIFLFAFCLRESRDPHCRPRRTELVANWAAKQSSLPQFTSESCAFFVACLEALRDWLENKVAAARFSASYKLRELCREWFDYSQSPAMLTGVMKKVQQSEVPHIDDLLSPEDAAEAIVEIWRSRHFASKPDDDAASPKQLQTEIKELLKNLVRADSDFPLKDDGLHVLFFFDEARQFNEASGDPGRFIAFRRAFRVLPWNSGVPNIFVVVTDTSSKLANFAPKLSIPHGDVGNRLFHPISLMMPLDSWWIALKSLSGLVADEPLQTLTNFYTVLTNKTSPTNDRVSAHQGVARPQVLREALTLKLIESFEFSCLFGRAAFFPLLLAEKATGSVLARRFLDFLALKLLKLTALPVEKLNLTNTQGLAILGSILSIEISAASNIASDLVSGHLRLVAGISLDRDRVFTLEVSEPPIAATCHDLFVSGRIKWSDVFRIFVSSACRSFTPAGFLGELAGQALCIIGWQKCLFRGQPKPIPSIPGPIFLDALFDRQIVQLFLRIAALERVISSEEISFITDVFARFENAGHTRGQVWKFFSRGQPADTLTLLLSGTGSSACIRALNIFRYLRTAGQLRVAKEGFYAALSLLHYQELKAKFSGSFVRVNQFVKTFSTPDRSMLFDYFIRSSAVACKEYQEAMDLIIPLYLPGGQFAKEENMSLLAVQMKDVKVLTKEAHRADWCKSVMKVCEECFGTEHPFIGIFFDLDPDGIYKKNPIDIRPLIQTEDNSRTKKRKTAACEPRGFAIFTTGLRPSDIDTSQSEADQSFKYLLNPTINPSVSPQVPEEDHCNIKRSFRCQPYKTPN